MMTLLNTAASFRRTLLFAGLTLFTLAAVPGAHAQSADAPSPETETAPDATVQVKGMACSMCARSMRNALESVEAVERADVDLDAQQVRLTFAGKQRATEKALRDAVEGAGYTFRSVAFSENEAADTADASDAR